MSGGRPALEAIGREKIMYTKERRGRRRRIRPEMAAGRALRTCGTGGGVVCAAGPHRWGADADRESALCVVCIDPGHGGSDQGTSWEGRLEKEDNLDMALALQRALEARNIYVVLTREDDTSLTLEERVAFAQAEQADYYISLHRNYADVSACGIEIWVAEQCSDAALSLAQEVEQGLVSVGPKQPGRPSGQPERLRGLLCAEPHHHARYSH